VDLEIQSLGATLIDEILNAVGVKKNGMTEWIFMRLFLKAAVRMASIGVTFDRLINSQGFPSACAWALTNWCRGIAARGVETIPHTGPLLVISNHAGAYDSIVIASMLGRNDTKFIASDVAFLKNLPSASSHFIFVSGDDPYHRMAAARSALHHLEGGGALILFGTGLIDPDPAVYPGAEKEIENWSPSIDLFLRRVPEANIVLAIVSGIVSPRWARHPLTWLKRISWQRRRLAEFGQVLEQLFFPGRLYVSPRLSFAPPVQVSGLKHETIETRVLPEIISRGKTLLAEHNAWSERSLGK
jgi:hypothetical protein